MIDRFLNRLAPYLETVALVAAVTIAYMYLWGMMADDNAGKARNFYLDLSGQVLVEEHNKEYENVYWHDFRGQHFEGADFSNSILRRANLQGAHLEGARLENVGMQDADLGGAYLSNAVLNKVKLDDARFSKADLTNAAFVCTDISKVDFTDAKMLHAAFINTNLCENKTLTPDKLSTASIIFNSDLNCDAEKQAQSRNLLTFDEIKKMFPDQIAYAMGHPPDLPGFETYYIIEPVYYFVLHNDFVAGEKWTYTESSRGTIIYREELFAYSTSCAATKH